MGAGEVLSAWDKINSWMAPLSGAVDAILRPLVQPLADQFDSITGDSEAVRSTAEKWRDMSAKLKAVGDFEAQVVSQVSSEWSGEAQQAFRATVEQLLEAIDDMAGQMTDTAEFLDDAAMEVETAEKLVEDIIRELIEWALISLAAGAVLSLVTFGASAAAGAAVAAAKAATAGSRIAVILTKVAAALTKLAEALRWLKTAKGFTPFVIKRMITSQVIKPVVRAGTGLTGDPVGSAGNDIVHGLAGIAADEYDDQVDGDTGVQTPLRDDLDDVVGPVADGTRGPAQAVDGVTDEVDDLIPSFPGG